MANPPAPPQANAVSQASQGASTSVFTERFDASQLQIGEIPAENSHLPESDIFSPQRVDTESPPLQPMPPIAAAAPVGTSEATSVPPTTTVETARRSGKSNAKFRYSNRKL